MLRAQNLGQLSNRLMLEKLAQRPKQPDLPGS